MSTAGSDRSLARSVALGGVAQMSARALDLVVSVIVSVIVLRYLGPAGNGDYVLILTIVGLVGLLAELGLPRVAVREMSIEPDRESAVLGTVVVLRCAGSLAAAAVAQVVLFAFGAEATLRLAVLVASIAFVADALLSTVAVFQARVVQHLEAVARLCGTVVKIVLALAIVRFGGGLVALAAIPGAALAVSALVAFVLARRIGVGASYSEREVRPLVRAALPVAPAALVGVLYLKLDAALIGLLTERADLGRYGAAYQPIEYLFLASAVIVQVLFPLLARAATPGNEPLFGDRYVLGIDLVVGAFAAIAAVLLATGVALVQRAYGADYEGAAGPMIVLGFALVFLAVNAWQGSTLLAVGRQAKNLQFLLVAVVANVAIDLVLIPAFGIIGAAIGTLVTAFGLTVASTLAVRRYAGAVPDGRSLVRLLAAAALAGAGAAGVSAAGAPLVVALVAALAAWVLGLVCCARPLLERVRRSLIDHTASATVVAGGVM